MCGHAELNRKGRHQLSHAFLIKHRHNAAWLSMQDLWTFSIVANGSWRPFDIFLYTGEFSTDQWCSMVIVPLDTILKYYSWTLYNSWLAWQNAIYEHLIAVASSKHTNTANESRHRLYYNWSVICASVAQNRESMVFIFSLNSNQHSKLARRNHFLQIESIVICFIYYQTKLAPTTLYGGCMNSNKWIRQGLKSGSIKTMHIFRKWMPS